MLPVTLQSEEIQQLFDAVTSEETVQLTIDLPNQTVDTPAGSLFRFSIDPFRKTCLLEGLDAIGLTLKRESAITAYEQRRMSEAPWLFRDLSASL